MCRVFLWAGTSWTKALCGCALALAFVFPAAADTISGRVVSVADGDTITVLDNSNTQHKIRLSGIDAPERAQPFGRKSREQLAELVAGKSVEVETDKTDRFGRSVGKVVLSGRDINLVMVVSGLAWHYKAYAKEQGAADRLLYADAEAEARQARRGLWLEADPVPPWDWRARKRGAQQ
jgi:endonuclease YncB( thermonuclease family)